MASDTRCAYFDFVAKLPVKAGESVKATISKPGTDTPTFVITQRIDGLFVMYSVEGGKLKKLSTADNVRELETFASEI